MNKTKTIKLGFFPFWVVVVYGGDFNEMVDAAVKAEPLLSPGFFEESRKSIASVYSDKDSNVCVAWFKPKAYERGYAAFYATVAHESLHVISAMRLSLGVDHLEEETYAYLLQYLMEEIGEESTVARDGEENEIEVRPLSSLWREKLSPAQARRYFKDGHPIFTKDGSRISKIDARRHMKYYCPSTDRWYDEAFTEYQRST